MWCYLVIFLYLFADSLGDSSSNYYCADLAPQQHIIMDQLMGIWYGVEIINHMEDGKRQKEFSTSCPIIYISQDHPASTMNPLFRNYNHSYGYGRGRGYGTPLPPYERYPQELSQQYRERMEYDRRTTYPDHPKRLNTDWIKPYEVTKYLRLYWDESSEDSNEYHLRYKENRVGLWINSGPGDGVVVDSRFSHFAGTVQVLKAVGDHLVLTFCDRVPKNKLYTVILSRDIKLESHQIHNIHGLLLAKGLSTNSVKYVCKNNSNKVSTVTVCLILVLVFCSKIVGFL